jgi:hypothetical protein
MKQRNLILDPAVDRLLVAAARGVGVSVNQFVTDLIVREVAGVGEYYGRGVGCGGSSEGVGVGVSGGRYGDGSVVGVFGAGRPVVDELLEVDSLDVIA